MSSAAAKISDFYRWLIGSSSMESHKSSTSEQPASDLTDRGSEAARYLEDSYVPCCCLSSAHLH